METLPVSSAGKSATANNSSEGVNVSLCRGIKDMTPTCMRAGLIAATCDGLMAGVFILKYPI